MAPFTPNEGVTLTISIPPSFGPTPIGQPVIAVFDAQGHESFSADASHGRLGRIQQTAASGAAMTFNPRLHGNPAVGDKTCRVVGDDLSNHCGG
jgi:hypothetical protein